MHGYSLLQNDVCRGRLFGTSVSEVLMDVFPRDPGDESEGSLAIMSGNGKYCHLFLVLSCKRLEAEGRHQKSDNKSLHRLGTRPCRR